jgi:plasmid maintenance system antidote protein VapI
VNGRAALSPEMALRVEKAFGVSMDTLLRRRYPSVNSPPSSI